MIIICPKCKKATAQRDIYTGDCVCYNAECEYDGPSVKPRTDIKKLFEPLIPTEPVIVEPLVDYDVD